MNYAFEKPWRLFFNLAGLFIFLFFIHFLACSLYSQNLGVPFSFWDFSVFEFGLILAIFYGRTLLTVSAQEAYLKKRFKYINFLANLANNCLFIGSIVLPLIKISQSNTLPLFFYQHWDIFINIYYISLAFVLYWLVGPMIRYQVAEGKIGILRGRILYPGERYIFIPLILADASCLSSCRSAIRNKKFTFSDVEESVSMDVYANPNVKQMIQQGKVIRNIDEADFFDKLEEELLTALKKFVSSMTYGEFIKEFKKGELCLLSKVEFTFQEITWNVVSVSLY